MPITESPDPSDVEWGLGWMASGAEIRDSSEREAQGVMQNRELEVLTLCIARLHFHHLPNYIIAQGSKDSHDDDHEVRASYATCSHAKTA